MPRKSKTSTHIKVGREARTYVPGHVFRQSAFDYEPMTFVTENERLKDITIEAKTQRKGQRGFVADPTKPYLYYVTGSPNDSKAKLFAAYLCELHTKANPHARVHWEAMYGGFNNPLLARGQEAGFEPSLIVLYGLCSDSSNVKLDKARDLLQFYNKIPRIVVAAGEDPVSFAYTKMFTKINALAYLSEGLIRQRVEII